jgi:signal transduction histidine kinase
MLTQGFRSRLMVGAVVWISLALFMSWFFLSALLREEASFIFRGELQEHAVELARIFAYDATGRFVLTQPLSDPRFAGEKSGYYWQAQRADGAVARSASLGEARLTFGAEPLQLGGERFSTIRGPSGDVLLVEQSIRLEGLPEVLRIGVGVDASVVAGVASRFERVVGRALAVIGVGLLLVAGAQVRFGFRYLGRVRKSLAEIRAGDANRLPEDLPSEVMPLVKDFNALLGANEELVRGARLEAGNLAHALKTPLAILMDEALRLESAGRGEEGERIRRQCERMKRAIDFQLARARASAARGTPGAVSKVGPLIASDVAALSRLYAGRKLSFDLSAVASDIVVACAGEDFEEMFAALVENAAKWAVRRVRVSTILAERTVCLRVEDDGPGMPEEMWDRVFSAGERLDESTPGSGLGLAIVRDLATLYGGKAWIESSTLGGAAAVLELPLAVR